jgi:hypothetical protein
MFDFIRRHIKFLQFVLVLLIFPSFVFFGIEGYSRVHAGGAAVPAAQGDGRTITQAEWDAAYHQQLERMRRQMPNVDSSLLDTPQMKRATLDSLVRENVLLAAAALDALFQQRPVHVQRVDTPDYAAKIEPPDAQLDAWYKDPAHSFQEQRRTEVRLCRI